VSRGLGGRLLDESYSPETRRHVVEVTVARLATNACYRFAPPFLASISDDFEISLTRLGVALMVTELFMALAPLLGAFVDRIHRRTAMVIGLAGVSGSATLAASSPSVWTFAIAITVLGLAKFIFDGGMTAWVNDHVDYERRGRVVGITETSWALGLLIGVTSMGLLASATSWRWGYIAGAVSVIIMAVLLSVRLVEPEHARHLEHTESNSAPLPRRGFLVIGGMFFLMAASQCMFVTFGSWLKDDFDFTDAGIAAVAFGFGAVELAASITSARRTDVWGKERSTMLGAALIIPSGVALLVGQNSAVFGLLLLAVFFIGFEFAIVSLLPIAANMIPGAPGRGLGYTIGGGTLGRAVMSVVATAAYESSGFGMPALIAAFCAAGVIVCIGAYARIE
jgi:MFS transporter, DHA1 family, inner membrane transport protein